MRLPKLLRTSSFRLTLLYAALFSVSALILFGAIYGTARFYLTSTLDADIESDVTELRQAAELNGRATLIETIDERVSQMPDGPIVYGLEDGAGTRLAGNLPGGQHGAGAIDLELPNLATSINPRGDFHIHRVRLDNGDYLSVGGDSHQLADMKAVIFRTFGWCAGITLLLAMGGGAILSANLLRRVETVSRTSSEIIAGNLARRIPLRGIDDEFDRLAANLNAMLDRTQRSMESVRQVSNDVAHDLRTPLTRLRQRLELARRKAQSLDELQNAIDRSIADTDAILDTFAALLRIAQVEGQASKARFRTLDLSMLLHTVAEVYLPIAEAQRQSLITDIAPDLYVLGDRELLTQLFANLVENALRHSPPGAAVTVGACDRGTAIEAIVADTGPGIPEALRGKVFQRFYRLDESRATPGQGLGLSLVAAIAGLHETAAELADNQPGLRVTLRFVPGPRPVFASPGNRLEQTTKTKYSGGSGVSLEI